MIELAFNNFGYDHLPEAQAHKAHGVEGLVRAARELGFSCFQYSIHGPQDPGRFAEIDMASLGRELDRTGVTMSLHHHAFDLLTLYHFAKRDAYADEFTVFVKAALDFIHATGGSLVTIHPPQNNVLRDTTGGYADVDTRRRAAAAYREALLELGEHALSLNMRIGIEAICFDDPFPGGTAFRGTDELDEFMRTSDLPPSVGLHVDTTHFHHKAINVSDVLRLWSDLLFDLHVSDAVVHDWVDADTYREQFFKEVHFPVGQGDIDFGDIVRTLRDIGYDRWLTFEIYPQQTKSVDDIVRSRELLEATLAENP